MNHTNFSLFIFLQCHKLRNRNPNLRLDNLLLVTLQIKHSGFKKWSAQLEKHIVIVYSILSYNNYLLKFRKWRKISPNNDIVLQKLTLTRG